jgi:hypothetical protein
LIDTFEKLKNISSQFGLTVNENKIKWNTLNVQGKKLN